jgi:hypothetical protein
MHRSPASPPGFRVSISRATQPDTGGTVSTIVTLKKPIKNGDVTINEIELQDPTAETILSLGFFIKNGDADFRIALAYIERLSGIQLPFLKKLSAPDVISLVSALSKMFATEDEDSFQKDR